jgi:hypothetical protein
MTRQMVQFTFLQREEMETMRIVGHQIRVLQLQF